MFSLIRTEKNRCENKGKTSRRGDEVTIIDHRFFFTFVGSEGVCVCIAHACGHVDTCNCVCMKRPEQDFGWMSSLLSASVP